MTTASRQSPMHDALEHLHPRWGQVNGMSAVASFADPQHESALCRTLALADVSALPRTLLKGPQAAAWIQRQGLSVPPKIYAHEAIPGGGLLIRTGAAEFFAEGAVSGDAVERLAGEGATLPDGVYSFPRQDAAMLLSGEKSFDVLAQTCGYNFRQPEMDFIMSRIAGVSCSILREDRDRAPLFHIWCDASYGTYLWETLLEISREAGGDAVGMSCFFPTAIK